MEDGNGEKPSGFKKILDFIKKNPALSGTIATVSLYALLTLAAVVLIIVIMQIITTAFSTLSGVFEKMFTSGEYKDMTLEEMQDPNFDFGNCYINSSDSWIGGVWDSIVANLGPGINHQCEVVALVKKNIKEYEDAYKFQGIDLNLSPGLVVSTIIYGYSSQPRIEGEKAVDPGQPMEVLADIVKEGIMNQDDITQMVGNMILTEGFWYYNCEGITCSASGAEIKNEQSSDSITSTEEVKNGKQCVRNYYLNATFSREKYMVYLLYGSGAASFYEMSYNHNKSINYICDTCYKKWNDDEYYNVKIDLDKYNIDLEDIKVVEESGTETKISESLTISSEEIEIYKKEMVDFVGNIGSVLKGITLSVYDFLNNSQSMTYTYKDGFIYNKFPNYKKAFEEGTKTESQMNAFGTIKNSLKSIASYEDAINKVYGLGEIPTMVNNSAKISIAYDSIAYECPSEESCNCSNGNLRPSSGGGGPTTTADSSACSYLPINTTSETMIRLRTCVGVEADISRIMPGGTATIDPETGYYVADVPITLKRYILGVAFAETGANEPVEGLKMQMLAAQTYLFNSLERGGIRKNSNGELLVKTCSTQFQAYYDEKVVKSYDKADSTKKKYFDDAYDAIKNQLVFDSRTNVTIFAEFGKEWTDARTVQANAGMLYTEMLTSSEVLNYSKKGGKKNWLYGVLHTCTAEESATGAGTFVPDEGVTSNYKTNSTYTQQSQTLGIFGYLTYFQPDSDNRSIRYDGRWESSNIVSVKKDCGNGLVVSWRVHKLAKTTFEKAAEGICQLTTTGIDGIIINPSNITFNGSFYPRKMSDALSSSNLSLHSFGVAVDINSNYNVTVNGTTYKDVYEHKNLKTYESFISALGSELDSRNVNYVLWKKVFQKLGFKWGGNWGRYGDDNEYDGMHFEIDWRQTK